MERVGSAAPSIDRRRTAVRRPNADRGARFRSLRAALVGLIAMTALAVGATGASAVVVRLQNGHLVSYQPVPGALPALGTAPGGPRRSAGAPLLYHGGPVMTSNTNYTFYWDPKGAPSYPAGYKEGINRYFKDLEHDNGGFANTDSVLIQYGDAANELANYNSHFAGELVDTNPYPPNGCTAAAICLTEAQIVTELTRYIEERSLPTDNLHEYFVLDPPGVEDCFEEASKRCSNGTKHSAYCAYHTSTAVAGGVVVWADDPFNLGNGCDVGEQLPNENASDATLGGGLAHEHSESVTDPEITAWYAGNGEEIGDKCRHFNPAEFGTPLGKAPDAALYNQVINGDLYYYQAEWSNEGGECEQRWGPPAVTKVSPKSGGPSEEKSVTITGKRFLEATAVKFGEVAAKGLKINSATSITVVAPAGTAGTVEVTVIGPRGTSPISSKDHFKYGNPTVTNVNANSGTKAGRTRVTVTGTGFALGAGTTFEFGKAFGTSVECISTTSCEVVTPAASKTGIVDVVAAVGKAKSKKSPADQFTYN